MNSGKWSRYARPYIGRLNLSWPVSFVQDNDEIAHRVLSDLSAKRHIVTLPEIPTEVDLVHELCHAALAERIDPNFATAYFANKYGDLCDKDISAFKKEAEMFYCSWCFIDLWVDELRHEYWPELTKDDHESFARGVYGLVLSGQTDHLRSIGGLMGISLQVAFQERNEIEPVGDLSPAIKALGQEATLAIDRLTSILKSLPRLSYNTKDDLVVLEKSVGKFAQAFDFPISPKLIFEEDRNVWVMKSDFEIDESLFVDPQVTKPEDSEFSFANRMSRLANDGCTDDLVDEIVRLSVLLGEGSSIRTTLEQENLGVQEMATLAVKLFMKIESTS